MHSREHQQYIEVYSPRAPYPKLSADEAGDLYEVLSKLWARYEETLIQMGKVERVHGDKGRVYARVSDRARRLEYKIQDIMTRLEEGGA